ncbi:MAG: hypothetical protein V4693_17030 [Pseudomonadota bacterium]
MKRTQSVILGLLALSLAACSYFPWKNTSGSSPTVSPSAGSSPAASNNPSSDSSTTARNNTGVGATGQN